MEPKSYLELVTQLGSFGVLVWILYWVFTRGLPKIEAALAIQREQFLKELGAARDAYTSELKASRDHCQLHNDRVDKLIDRLEEKNTGARP